MPPREFALSRPESGIILDRRAGVTVAQDAARGIAAQTGGEFMFAKINHVAMASANYALVGKFYEVLFGLKTSKNPRPEAAVAVGDGYVGLNINPRRPGRAGGLDHFGIQVDTPEALDVILERAIEFREADPRVEISDRMEQDFKVLVLHSVYVRYLLPMQVEIQCFQWSEGVDAFSGA